MHRIAVLALDRVIAFDLAIPCQVFDAARLPDGSRAYEVMVCGSSHVAATSGAEPQFTIRAPYGLADARRADTIVVPGLSPLAEPPPRRVLQLLRAAAADGVRIASVCTGAFVLAAAGLLDGLRATTHWHYADDLATRYPAVDVDPDVLFVDNNGSVLTSAGLAAGLDLCLYMVGTDYGAGVAADVARGTVVPLVRDGGQAQFIVHKPPEDLGVTLQQTLQWMHENLHHQLTLEDIAAHAITSVRTLNRRFREQIGTTPLQWLLQARVERAKELLETTNLSVERIADEVGFGASVTLRQHFARRVGIPPQRYRDTFRTRAPAAAAT